MNCFIIQLFICRNNWLWKFLWFSLIYEADDEIIVTLEKFVSKKFFIPIFFIDLYFFYNNKYNILYYLFS